MPPNGMPDSFWQAHRNAIMLITERDRKNKEEKERKAVRKAARVKK